MLLNVVPTKVHASPSVDDLRNRAHSILKLEAFKRCVDQLLIADGITTGDSLIYHKPVEVSIQTYAVGHGVDSEDGQWDCYSSAGEREDLFLSLLYKNGSDTQRYTGWDSGSDPYSLDTNCNVEDIIGTPGQDLYFINRNNEANPKVCKGATPADSLEGNDGGPAKAKLGDQINHSISVYEKGLSSDEKAAMRYISLMETFVVNNACGASKVTSGVPTNKQTVSIDNTTYTVTNDGDVSVGFGSNGASNGTLTCSEIAKELNATLASYKKVFSGSNSQIPPGTATTTATTTTTTDSCESQDSGLAWVVCPVLRMVGGAFNWVDTQLSHLLEIDRNKYTNPDMYAAWAQFRNIGLTLLIAAMLVMVISTALGVSFLDAYTVKKAFPRMVMSIIFMLLSWYVCIFLIDVVNVVGRGILGLMTAPFHGQAQSLTSLFNGDSLGPILLAGGVGAAGISLFATFAAPGILLTWIGTGLLILGIAFLVLIARQMFIIALILFSPLAILSWIFPGNDKLWKLWWQTFSKLLFMYPIIMALIASGRIFAGVVNITPTSNGEALLNSLIKLTAYVIPYAFIPFTFKAAGGVFGNLVGMANDRGKGAFDKLRKSRQKRMSDFGRDLKGGQGFRGKQGNVLNSLASGAGAGPKGWGITKAARGRRNAIRETNFAAAGIGKLKDNSIYDLNKGNDMFLLAGANQALANEKIAEAKKSLTKAQAEGDRQKVAELEQEITARQRASALAQSIVGTNRSTQRQFALDLAATGYQVSPGQKGYDEISAISNEVFGNDEASRINFMNTMQYNLKGAGRSELAGINNAAGLGKEGVKSGVRKLGNYQRGQGKKDTYYGAAAAWLGKSTVDANGATLKGDDLINGIATGLANKDTKFEDISEWHSMLLRDESSATDANKLEIQKQLKAIEGLASSYKGKAADSPEDYAAKVKFINDLNSNRRSLQQSSIDPSERDKL